MFYRRQLAHGGCESEYEYTGSVQHDGICCVAGIPHGGGNPGDRSGSNSGVSTPSRKRQERRRRQVKEPLTGAMVGNQNPLLSILLATSSSRPWRGSTMEIASDFGDAINS
mmetsp:Transcript_1968/g.5432  ORF Transcript_1968/g.5432 Transcript_1968/m.5432 type:complete len:111 (-) Transcript_1968:32-364(-)